MPKGAPFSDAVRQQTISDYKVMSAAKAAAKNGVSYSIVVKWVADWRASEAKKADAEETPVKRPFVIKKTPKPEPVAAAPEPAPLSLAVPARRELREVKAAPVLAAPAPTPEDARVEDSPPPSAPPTPPSRPSWGYKGFGCDFAGTARFLIGRLYPVNNQPIWTLFKMLLDQGGDLEVISPYHSKDGNDYYFSIRLDGAGTFYTAHFHGPLVGSKFTLNRAVVFHKSDSYELNFVKRNPTS